MKGRGKERKQPSLKRRMEEAARRYLGARRGMEDRLYVFNNLSFDDEEADNGAHGVLIVLPFRAASSSPNGRGTKQRRYSPKRRKEETGTCLLVPSSW